MTPIPTVLAVSAQATHTFTKTNLESITLIAGQGVSNDAHAGETVQHLYLPSPLGVWKHTLINNLV
jgi:hypothetical protein